jgi:hypothetical protein
MKELEVIEIGSSVMLDGEIPATVTGLEVRGAEHLLTYQVTWWDERSRKSEWVTPRAKAPRVYKTSIRKRR